MLVTLDWIREKYHTFNEKLFGGELPREISFKISTRENTWGYASCQFRYLQYENRVESYDFKITISNAYDSPEWVKENTLVHEMIHILDYIQNPHHFVYKDYKGWHQRRGYDAHGPLFFLKEAERLSQYGFNIQRLVSAEETEVSNMTDKVKQRIDNKKKKGYILACGFYNPNYPWTYYPKNEAMWFKTTENGIKNIVNNILNYRRTDGKYSYLSIVAYKTTDEKYKNYGGCRDIIKGWYCSVPEWDKMVSELSDKQLFDHWTFEQLNESVTPARPARKMLIDGENGIAKLNADDTITYRMA